MSDEMKVDIDDCRAAFEHWYSDEGRSPRAVARIGGHYELMQAQSSWVAWQAAATWRSIVVSDVARFTPDCEPCNGFDSWVGVMRDDPHGFYVRHADYAALQREASSANALADQWHERLETAYLELDRLANRDQLQQQLAAAREALALFIEFDDAGEPPGDICFEKARATLQRDRQP